LENVILLEFDIDKFEVENESNLNESTKNSNFHIGFSLNVLPFYNFREQFMVQASSKEIYTLH